jgi:acetyl esterase
VNRLGRATTAAVLSQPRWITRLLRAPAPARAGGLDPQLAALLTLHHRGRIPALETLSVAGARRLSDEGLAPLDCAPLPMAQLIEVASDAATGRPPLRLYRPFRRGRGLLVYFHGGGGVIGSIESHDAWCRSLAHHAEVQVASVEYRLAPEHPHPAAVEDALAAWRWAVENGPRLGATRLGVGGDSFGGYLSAVVDQATSRPAHHSKTLPGAGGLPPPALQALIYPLVDFTLSSPSIEGNGEGYLLTASTIRWFRSQYWGGSTAEQQRAASPLFAPAMPSAAPALLVLAGFDPLIDEGHAYANRLGDEAGAAVEVMEHADLIHGFVVMTGAIARARQACLQLCERVRDRLA